MKYENKYNVTVEGTLICESACLMPEICSSKINSKSIIVDSKTYKWYG